MPRKEGNLWIKQMVIVALVSLTITSCTQPHPRLGMVQEPNTGLMYGSTISNNLVTDPSFFANRRIKVRVRNTSGDTAFDLHSFSTQLTGQYVNNGYEAATGDDYGLLVDVNVMHSGHIQTNYASTFSFLGGSAGTIIGTRSNARSGSSIGSLTGLTAGAVLGSNVTEDTYMIVAQVTFGVLKRYKSFSKRITFSQSVTLENVDDPDEEDVIYRKAFKKTYTTNVGVYGGGRNILQSEVVQEVKARIIRIVGEFI